MMYGFYRTRAKRNRCPNKCIVTLHWHPCDGSKEMETISYVAAITTNNNDLDDANPFGK